MSHNIFLLRNTSGTTFAGFKGFFCYDKFVEDISLFLKDKRNLFTSLVLFVMIFSLPLGIWMVRQTQQFFSQAAGETISLAEGDCIKTVAGKKVAICPTIPLKLILPFTAGNVSPSPSPSAAASTAVSPSPAVSGQASASPSPSANASTAGSASPSPSPSPSVAPAQTVRVTGNTDVEIQAALNQVKTSGGAVYMPAGTYTINKKIRVFSNVTLFGAGIDQTILDATSAIGAEEPVMGNDSNAGQRNVSIRDMTVKGYWDGTGEVLKLRNLDGGFIHNIKLERAKYGLLLGFHNGLGVKNVRVSNCQVNNTRTFAIFISLGENNVIDHCTIDSGGSDSLGIGLEIGVEGRISNNRVLSNSVSNGGHSYSFTAGNDTQYESSWINSNNIVCYNTASGNKIQPIWDQRGTNNVYVGNNVNVSNVNSFGFEEKGGTDPRCDIPAALNTIPPAPAVPQAFVNPEFNPVDAIGRIESHLVSVYEFFSNLFKPKPVFAAGGFSDTETNGCGVITTEPAQGASEGNLVFKAPVRVNNQWQTQKPDGTVVTQAEMVQRAQGDPRVGNVTFFGDTYINCNVFIAYTQSADCDVDPPPKGREGVNGGKLAPGESVTFHVRLDSTPQSDGCRIQMQTEISSTAASPSPSPSPAASGASPSPSASAVQSPAASSSPSAAASVAASVSTSPVPSGSTECSDGRDNDGDGGTDTTDPQCHTDWNSGNAASFDYKLKYEFFAYRLAESEGELANTDWEVFASDSASGQFAVVNYALNNEQPGVKQIWVEYRNPKGETKVDHLTFDLLETPPEVSGVNCTMDIARQNLKVDIIGSYFGSTNGTISIDNANAQVLSWTQNNISGIYKSANVSSEQGKQYKVKIKRSDTLESEEQICAVDTTLLSLGARVFCREEGQFDAANVKVSLFATNLQNSEKLDKAEETVTIDKSGIVQGLKTKLQAGRRYAVSIKAPNSLRKNAIFTASEGTTVVNGADKKPFILPIGDIAPAGSTDGVINSLDASELIKQWKVLSSSASAVLTGDFNKDTRVNSIDWACMKHDFDAKDDSDPTNIEENFDVIFNTEQ